MSFAITDWLISGDISPLRWGDSSEKLKKLFSGSYKNIALLKKQRYPYIVLDFVEFYFTDDKNFLDLVEIIIKPISLYNGIETTFIDADWLKDDLTFDFVSNKLTELAVIWEVEREPYFDTPNIRTSTGVLFAFDPDRESDNEAELIKIYLKK